MPVYKEDSDWSRIGREDSKKLAAELPPLHAPPENSVVDRPRSSPSIVSPPLVGLSQRLSTRPEGEDKTRQAEDSAGDNNSKRAAIGSGNSPTSSVKTSHSYGEPRWTGVVKASPSIVSTKEQNRKQTVAQRSRESERQQLGRPPVAGKRLYEPDFDRSTLGQTHGTPASSRPRSSHNQQKSRGNHNPVSGIQQRSSSVNEQKLIPINILNSQPTISHEGSNPDQLEIVRQPETRPISQEQLV
jgi:hypothetical protein